MSRPFKLYRLQQIDNQLDGMHARLSEIEAALNEGEALRQATELAEDAKRELHKSQLNLRQAEESLRLQQLKIEEMESTLYGGKVRNPKELQDLQNDVAALKRYQAVLEDRQLDAMLAEEEAISKHEKADNDLDAVRQQHEQRLNALQAEKIKMLKDTSRLEDERQAAGSSIPAEDMVLYDQLRKQRRGIAVAKVSDRACSACGSMLNAALLNAAHSPNQLTRCDACGRILYVG
jgi:predicted  nucleic acid-binding Zn-ribbon protein